MGNVTNRHRLPAPLVNALNKQHYSRGASRASVTTLIDSPRVDCLRQQHAGDIVEDVSDRLWALLGTAMHAVLELGADADHLSEQRLFANVEGWLISGGIDLQKVETDAVGIRDYKLCSTWSVLNPKSAWEEQLNCYAWLVRQNKGLRVTDLQVIAVCRDWSRAEAERRPEYPQSPVVPILLRLWSPEEADAYVRGRVKIHQDAQRARDWGEPLPLCTPAERWDKPTFYAVMKPGAKRAKRVFEDAASAKALAATIPTSIVVERPGESTRCAGDYCRVSRWCEQRAAQLRNQVEAPEDE